MHQQDVRCTREMSTCRDADGFFFLRHLDEPHIRIFFRQFQQIDQPRFRQRSDEVDARVFNTLINGLGVIQRNGHP